MKFKLRKVHDRGRQIQGRQIQGRQIQCHQIQEPVIRLCYCSRAVMVIFEESDKSLRLPVLDGTGFEEIDLTQLSALNLLDLCKKYGLKTTPRKKDHYLAVLRSYSSNPSKRRQLSRVDDLVPDPYGLVSSTVLIQSISSTRLVTARPLLKPTQLLQASAPFSEKFEVTLSYGRSIKFSAADIAAYPSVPMPKASGPYLKRLLCFWDDDLPMWNPDICPKVNGTVLPAKYWKVVFSKAGHWKKGAHRTQWHRWKRLIETLAQHGYKPEALRDNTLGGILKQCTRELL
ncbi:hypothetical protein C8R42DRAFT_644521 [Lentinula raphanica]|nr:hypothetical protein C8R42DRAFT_644521 [Lentinula raphanica]